MLKKVISAALAAALLLTMTACGGGSKEPAAPALKDGVTLQQVIDQVNEAYPVAMPAPVDETILNDLLNIPSDDVEEYAGYITMVMVSADNLIGVKAKPDKVESVQKALEGQKEMMVQSFEQYLPEQLDKAQAGKVVTFGNYVFLIIVGSEGTEAGAGIAAAEELIKGNFDNLT